MRLKTAWHILRYLGPGFVWQRFRIAVENKLGRPKRVYAARPWESISLAEICTPGTPTDAAEYDEFKRNQDIPFIANANREQRGEKARSGEGHGAGSMQRTPAAEPAEGGRATEPAEGGRATPSLAERLRLIAENRHVYCFRTPSPRAVDWSENGLTGQRARSSVPWYAVRDFDPSQGDIRTLWDPARANWAIDLLRGVAHGLIERHQAAALYWRWVDSWMAACPPWMGVHWKCGQESSVRMIGLALGFFGGLCRIGRAHPPAAAMLDEPSGRDAVVGTAHPTMVGTAHPTIPGAAHHAIAIARIAWATGYRVAHHIDYAVSQKNNHAISEACGLILVSHLFPEFREAAPWKALGRRVLTQELRRQIYADGSYVQHSMNYQRVMMHGATLALRLAELQNDPLPRDLYERLGRCAQFMHELMDARAGRMPNFGNNDGACVLPLTDCDYADFRPVIQSTHFLATRRRLLPAGPWDEETAWLFADELDAPPSSPAATRSPAAPSSPAALGRFGVSGGVGPAGGGRATEPAGGGRATEPAEGGRATRGRATGGGYFVIRRGESWVMLRCHSYRDRPAHLDMLHVDLWWRGLNILQDAGTYQYFIPDHPALERYFKSIRAHNTIEIDAAEPLQAATRFLWLPWPKARVISAPPSEIADRRSTPAAPGEPADFAGEHYAYARPPWHVVHRRTLRAAENGWSIVDELRGRRRSRQSATLRWRMADVPVELDAATGRVSANTPVGRFSITVESGGAERLSRQIVRGQVGDELSFAAPYYAELQPTPTLVVATDWMETLVLTSHVRFD
ncbi:Heparin-sulfate lyase precursor [Phycisphaerae bacterium RAS1]|nr:Heparin-sulfate lyase precursor [Phycisphaerae bacterium RAS1]